MCPSHGGSAPAVKSAAQRRLKTQQAEADARAVLAHEGITPITSPLEELGRLTSEVLAFKDALAQWVNAIQGELSQPNSLGTEQLRAEVELYERALDRSGRFLDLLARNGFEEQRLRLAESQAVAVVAALTRTLAGLGLNAQQQEQARVCLADELRALETGEPR